LNRKEKNHMKQRLYVLVVTFLTLSTLGIAQNQTEPSAKAEERITREVRHELLMLPYYGVFDNLAFQGEWLRRYSAWTSGSSYAQV
jgi:hypothetical protein